MIRGDLFLAVFFIRNTSGINTVYLVGQMNSHMTTIYKLYSVSRNLLNYTYSHLYTWAVQFLNKLHITKWGDYFG